MCYSTITKSSFNFKIKYHNKIITCFSIYPLINMKNQHIINQSEIYQLKKADSNNLNPLFCLNNLSRPKIS